MNDQQTAEITRRVEAHIKKLEARRDEAMKDALHFDREAQSLRQVMKGPRGVLTPRRRGQLMLLLGDERKHFAAGMALPLDAKVSWERGADAAEFLNAAGWLFMDKRGKPRRLTKRDADNGFASLNL